jgi:hypothetical protein
MEEVILNWIILNNLCEQNLIFIDFIDTEFKIFLEILLYNFTRARWFEHLPMILKIVILTVNTTLFILILL